MRRRRTLFEGFRDEKQFWRLFRMLLLPFAAGSFLFCVVVGVSAAVGEEGVYFGNKAVTGWKGFVLAVAYSPLVAVMFALMFSSGLYFERTIWPAAKQRILQLLGRS